MAAARAGAHTVAESLTIACDAVRPARPTGAKTDWRELSAAGGAVWARRGEVLAVHAPGNAPGVHGLWPQALALGYRVAVRPSRREPFTAHRLIHALRQAGFRAGDALYLPTDHTVADDVIRAADLAMVYGGQDVVDRYAQDPRVLTNGPGRTKILITAECDWRELPRRDRRLDRQPGRDGVRQRHRRVVRGRRRAVGACHRRPVVDDRTAAQHRRTGHSANDFHRCGAGSRRSPRGQGRRDGSGAGRRSGGRRPRRRVRRAAPGRAPAGHTRPGQAQRRTALPLRLGLAVVTGATASRPCGTRWCST